MRRILMLQCKAMPQKFSPGFTVRYCPRCGGSLTKKEVNHHPRLVCQSCGRVHYMNPAVGVAVIIRRGTEILWGRRSGGKYQGAWCLPCGYVEWGEEVRTAAAREFEEETGLQVEVGEVVAVHSNFHDPERLTVGIWFAGKVTGGVLAPGDDLDEARFFPLTAPPAPLAFPTDEVVLEELRSGKLQLVPVSELPG